MKTIKLNLELSIPEDALVIDVTALMSAVRFLLRGFFPRATLRTEMALPAHNPQVVPHTTLQ